MPKYLVPGTGNMGTDYDDHVPLTLVNWSPHSLSRAEPMAIKNVVRDLFAMQTHLGLDLFEIQQWVPAEKEVESVRFALNRGEPSWAREAFLGSLQASTRSIENIRKGTAVALPPTDMATAVQQLHAVMVAEGGESSRQRRKEALFNYQRVVARQITEPMMRQAEKTVDPLERSLRLQFAQLNALFLSKAPTVHEHALDELSATGNELKKGTEKSVLEWLAISSQLVTLAKELTKWSPRGLKQIIKRESGPSVDLSRRFTDSDLVAKN
jgi:hypothetical protein